MCLRIESVTALDVRTISGQLFEIVKREFYGIKTECKSRKI